jgi:hypothetical protein
MISAQAGHFCESPALRWRWSIARSSRPNISANGSARMKKRRTEQPPQDEVVTLAAGDGRRDQAD